ncbi:MAG: DUF1905 domain-containing protein [Acidobacteriota bacterium]|nr:DUF1905 domain-containing protein [Acidobacteriota bacterium]MDE3043783.1 DUF1905 domain-containing protein [Acidobacteriota bacterium]MDE3107404.1 DUF1905 domain-containing protein [Acidobacteriota bacterium]
MMWQFRGQIWFWRGPSPFYFVTVPELESAQIAQIAKSVTYGWGVIPVEVTVGATTWTTSLFPKDGRYVVPVKVLVRKAENLELEDEIEVRLRVVTPLERRAY